VDQSVKVAWLVYAGMVALVVVSAWKNPRTAVPISVGVAAATALAVIFHF
jgi:hypothetical protein